MLQRSLGTNVNLQSAPRPAAQVSDTEKELGLSKENTQPPEERCDESQELRAQIRELMDTITHQENQISQLRYDNDALKHTISAMQLAVIEQFKPMEGSFSLKDLDDVLLLFGDDGVDL